MEINKKIKILCSIDDGDQLDMTTAELLLKYRIPTVFYIPGNCSLSNDQIRKLAGIGDCETCNMIKGLFDIGAHTMTHPQDLKKLNDRELRKEIYGSKLWLEKVIERPVTRFCYPRGRFDKRVKEAVKLAGFKEARVTKGMNIEFPKDSFETKPTIHIYPEKPEYGDKTWMEIAKEKLYITMKEGGRFELWGHSYEIFDKFNMEEFFEDFLAYMDEEMKKINYSRKI